MILEKVLEVRNKRGLHTRPAAYIAKMLAKTSSLVYFTCNSIKVDAKQVMNLLLLGAGPATQITISVEGADADLILKQLTSYFQSEFKET